MDSEAKIIIVFLFNRSGKNELTEAELYLPLSMELGWLSTKESQEFVKYAINQGLLVKKEGLLHPNFPLETIRVPVGFIPSKKIFSKKTDDKKEENIIEGIATQICTQTHQNQQDIREEIKKEEIEKKLIPEVAALYVARKHGVDISNWYAAVEKEVIKENKG
jgi:hypothetical protein